LETVFWLELAIQMKERSSPPPPPSCWSQGTLVQALEHLSLSTWLPSSHSSPSSTLPSPQAGGGSPVVASVVVASVSLVETISVVDPVAVVVASVAESVAAVVAVVDVVASVAESLSVPAVVVAVSDSPAVPAVVPTVVAVAVVPAVVAVAVVSSVALLVSSPLHAVTTASVSAVRSWIEVVGR
jgi:hypothetical protein